MGNLQLLISRCKLEKCRMERHAIKALLVTLLLSSAWVVQGSAQAAAADQRGEAAAFEQQGKFPEAEAAWRAVLKAHPSSAEANAHLGLLEARQDHYKEAIPFYRKAVALSPAMPGLRLNLGLALFKGGELKESIQQFQLLKAKSTGSSDSQRLNILIGMAHYGLGEYAEAARFLKQAAAVDTGNLQLRLALAHSCLWSKQYQCVLDTYHEMLSLNAESAEVDMLAGEADDEMKNYDDAIAQFRAAVEADPKEPDVHFGLGYILWTQRQYPEAATELHAELDNNPNHAQSLVYLGDTQMQLDHPELAKPLLEKAARLDPALALAHIDLGILDDDAGRKDDALKELTTAVKLAPNDVNAHWRLGKLYRTMGRQAESKAEFDKARSLNKATDNALLERMSSGHAKPPAPSAPQQ